MKKVKTKRIALSIVALILVTLTAVGVTYSWIDDLKMVEFQNDDVSDNKAPLKAGVDINSDVVITEMNHTVNLGNIIEDSDILYTTGSGDNVESHVKYNDRTNTAAKAPVWERDVANDPYDPAEPEEHIGIKEKKGYFYESGGMHLSPCYGDGENFFFPLPGTNAGFREGNKDDENVNYISMTLRVSSPNANVEFWFPEDDQPYICQSGNTSNKIANARFSISVNGTTHVYSNSGSALTRDPDNPTDTTSVDGARSISAFTYYTSDSENKGNNNTADRGYNGNTLFSIKKGSTVNLNVKIWLEGGFSAQNLTDVDVNFKLVSSWGAKRTITIDDKTSARDASSWIGHDGAKMYLTLPAVLMEINNTLAAVPGSDYAANSVAGWDDLSNEAGYDYAPFYKLVKVGSTYTVQVPLVFNNEHMVLFRCNGEGWNKGSASMLRGPDGYKVKCWNWWESYLPDSFHDEKYTLYGSSYDKVANDRFGGGETNKGYGTWSEVVEITIDPKTKSLSGSAYGSGGNLANTSDSNNNMFVRDYTDYSTSGEIYTYVMRIDGTLWKTYVPVTSNAIQFAYWNNSVMKYWGYKSWTGNNPQMRPQGTTKYYATQVVEHQYNNIHNQGVGYWDGADEIYLIKNVTVESGYTLAAKMYYSSVSASAKTDPEYITMQKATGLSYGDSDGTYDVYKTNSSANNTPAHFYRCKFAKVGTSNTIETDEKILFPGCYYDWKNNRWLGALTADDRGGGADDEDVGGGDVEDAATTPITTGEPSEDGIYLYGKLSGGSSEDEYAKFDSTSSGGKVVLAFTSGKNYSVKVKKKSGSTWTTYGNSEYKAFTPLSLGSTQSSWNLSSAHSQKLQYFPDANGTFTFKLGSASGNTQTVSWKYE